MMKAIRFNFTIPRYIFGRVAEKIYPPLLWNGLSCTSFKEVPEPDLPGPEWVKIRSHLSGICGTDTNTVYLYTSTYYEPLASFPFTLGHENVGTMVEVGPSVQGWQVGDRVTIEPTLWCAPRGFVPAQWCEPCKAGRTNLCSNTTKGDLSPGWGIGACTETGGSWSPVFTAHHSQLYRIPDNVSDENALLVEPFAVGLHAALKNMPVDSETVLILGAGTVGLMQLAALRSLGSKAEILITARYPFQAEAAHKLGASEVLSDGDLFSQIAERTNGIVFKPQIGKKIMVGGVDRTFECIGNDGTLDAALRMTKPGGHVIVVGIPGMVRGLDWSSIFIQELNVSASYLYDHAAQWNGKTTSTFEIALEMMSAGAVDLGWMVTHRYPLEEYDTALRQIADKKRFPVIKPVFEFNDS
jgi:threonine dehydrogenase-like Zn-dependent dehydrogenase